MELNNPIIFTVITLLVLLIGRSIHEVAGAIESLAYQYRYQNEENRKHQSMIEHEKIYPSLPRMVSGTYSTPSMVISTKQFGEQ